MATPPPSSHPGAPLDVLVVDRSAAARAGLRLALPAHGLAVAGVAAGGEAAERLAAGGVARAAVVGDVLPEMPAEALVRRLQGRWRIPCVLLAAEARGPTGARMRVPVEAPLADLAAALRHVAGEEAAAPARVVALRSERPSPEELRVLTLLSQGEGLEAIGAALAATPDEVRRHLESALRHLGARSVACAIATAMREGLIDPWAVAA